MTLHEDGDKPVQVASNQAPANATTPDSSSLQLSSNSSELSNRNFDTPTPTYQQIDPSENKGPDSLEIHEPDHGTSIPSLNISDTSSLQKNVEEPIQETQNVNNSLQESDCKIDMLNPEVKESKKVESYPLVGVIGSVNGEDSPERAKKIFQKPPEEYLAMLEEDDQEEEEEEIDVLPTPPDGGWGWMVVFGSFMIHVFADGFTYTFGIFYVHLLNYFQVSKAAASWIVSILVGVTLGSGPISGMLVNKWGCRAVTIGGAFLASLMIFLSIYATSVNYLYLTIGLGAGMGFGLIYLPAIVSVSGYFEKKRSFATGIAVCGSGLGTFIFSPLTNLLIEEYSWKGALIVISGLTLNCVFFGALFRPLPTNPKKATVKTGTRAAPSIKVSDSNRHSWSEYREAARSQRDGRRYVSMCHSPTTFKPVDILRINSHGSLNPVLVSIRNGEAGLRMTASQPLFAQDTRSGERTPAQRINSHTGPLLDLPPHQNSHSLRSLPINRRQASSNRNSYIQPNESEVTSSHKPKSAQWLETLKSYMDLTLLYDPIFIIFAVSNFLTSIGFYAPYVFVADRGLETGLTSSQSYNLLSIIGISNTVSRVVLGYISDLKFVNRLFLYNWALTICGIATCASSWWPSLTGQVIYAAIFGATSGAYVGLTSVVLADLLGIERLTNAFGLLLLFQGIASVAGPPFCAWPYSFTGNYDYTFYVAGGMIAASGIMLFWVPCLQRRIARSS